MGQGGEDAPGFGGGPFTDAVPGKSAIKCDPVWIMHADSCGTDVGNIQALNLRGGVGGTAPAIVLQRCGSQGGGFVITSSCLVTDTRRQLCLCQSHLRLLKLCHAWKLSQSSLAQILKKKNPKQLERSSFWLEVQGTNITTALQNERLSGYWFCFYC